MKSTHRRNLCLQVLMTLALVGLAMEPVLAQEDAENSLAAKLSGASSGACSVTAPACSADDTLTNPNFKFVKLQHKTPKAASPTTRNAVLKKPGTKTIAPQPAKFRGNAQ